MESAVVPESELRTPPLGRHLRPLHRELIALLEVVGRLQRGEAQHADYATFFQTTKARIALAGQELATLETGSPRSGDIRQLRISLDQLTEQPVFAMPAAPDPAALAVQQRSLIRCEEMCNKAIYAVSVFTIPVHIDDWQRDARSGQALPYFTAYRDLLPNAADRQRLLDELAWTPQLIRGGLPDPRSGLIAKYSPRPVAILASVALVLGVFVGLLYLLRVAGPVLTAPGQLLAGLADPLELLWIAVVSGLGVHVVVTTAKWAQAQPQQVAGITLGTIPLWIDASLGRIMFKVLLTVIGLVGLIVTTGAPSVTLLNAFLVGYSLDSVVDLFGASASQQAARQTMELRRQLGLASASEA